jgi:hypothetical protein
MIAPMQFEMSADARFLYQSLRAAKAGDVVTYAELGEVIGKIVHGGMGALQTAIRVALREDRFVFSAVRKVGVKRLTDAEIVTLGESETSGTHRRVKRTARRLTAIQDYASLSPPSQLRHTALLSVNTMIADATRVQNITRVANVSHGRSTELPIHETLKAMGFE